jgi:hypothetical protein
MPVEKTTRDDGAATEARDNSLKYALIIFAIIEALILIPFLLFKILR